jgi:hypothetical protein
MAPVYGVAKNAAENTVYSTVFTQGAISVCIHPNFKSK